MSLVLYLMQNENRRRLNREGVFRDRRNPLDFMNDHEIVPKYRLDRPRIILLNESLKRTTGRWHSLPVALQVTTALRYFAKGDFRDDNGEVYGISAMSVSRCVNNISIDICRRLNQFISYPLRENRTQREIKQGFHNIAGFPNVLGVIDGSLVPIQVPSDNEPRFVCRRGYHAINVQLVADAQFLHMMHSFGTIPH